MHQIIDRFIAGLKLIEQISNDPQLDPYSEEFLGFVNVGQGIWVTQEMEEAWQHVCDHPMFFQSIIEDIGLAIDEGGRLNLHETVFVKKT